MSVCNEAAEASKSQNKKILNNKLLPKRKANRVQQHPQILTSQNDIKISKLMISIIILNYLMSRNYFIRSICRCIFSIAYALNFDFAVRCRFVLIMEKSFSKMSKNESRRL